MAIFSAVMPCRWRTQGPQAVPWCHKLGVCRTLCCRSWKSIGNGYELYFVTKKITRSNEKFILYVPFLQYYYYLLCSSTCQQGSDWLVGRRRTNYHLSLLRRGRGGGRRGVTEELKYALVRTDRLTQSTSADWNKIHNVGKIIYTLLIVLLQACEISQPI